MSDLKQMMIDLNENLMPHGGKQNIDGRIQNW